MEQKSEESAYAMRKTGKGSASKAATTLAILDSGCSPTSVKDEKLLNKPRPTSGNTGIMSAGGAILMITAKGELKIGKSIPPICNINLIPLLGDNLLSVSQLTNQWDIKEIFNKDSVKITKSSFVIPQSEIILNGIMHDGLYWVDLQGSPASNHSLVLSESQGKDVPGGGITTTPKIRG